MRFFPAQQKGSVLILFAITIPLLFVFSAIAFDLGSVYVQRAHMQNIADAAALAGAKSLNGTTNDTDARNQVSFYISQNNSDSDTAAGQTSTITHPYKNDLQKIQVTLTEDIPLFFFKYFGYNSMHLSVSAVASNSGSGNDFFKYDIISGSTNGILDLGSGGSNIYNASLYSNNQISQGGGTNIVNGDIYTVNTSPWSKISQNSFTLNGTLHTGQPIRDISLEKSGLSSLVEQIKKQNTYNGDYTAPLNLPHLGSGIYVKGSFKPSWTQGVDATTVVIAEGNISIPGNNGMNMSPDNYVIYCSLNGDITLNFSAPFYGILYAPNGHIKLIMGSRTYYGKLVGQTLSLGDGTVTINSKNFPISGSGTGKVSLIE